MFCPICGDENPKDARFCESCGESLEKEVSFEGRKKNIGHVSFISFAMIFVGMFGGIWQITVIASFAFLSCLIVYMILPKFSGKHAKRYCPRCEQSQFNENYCVECGYNLNDVLGYYKTDHHDIEMNKNYIKIYEKTRYQEGTVPDREGWHSHHRAEPITFTLDKITNLQLAECKHFLSHSPCLIFEYDTDKCNFYLAKEEEFICMVKAEINSRIKIELEKVLSSGVYDNIWNKDGI